MLEAPYAPLADAEPDVLVVPELLYAPVVDDMVPVVPVSVEEEDRVVLLHPASTTLKAIGNRMDLFIGGFSVAGRLTARSWFGSRRRAATKITRSNW